MIDWIAEITHEIDWSFILVFFGFFIKWVFDKGYNLIKKRVEEVQLKQRVEELEEEVDELKIEMRKEYKKLEEKVDEKNDKISEQLRAMDSKFDKKFDNIIEQLISLATQK